MHDVVSALNYLAPGPARVRTYAYDPPDGSPRFDGRLESRSVSIADARALESPCTLASHGFQLCTGASAVKDFWDEGGLRALAYPEAEAMACAVAGASRAVAFDHTLRRRAPERPPLDGTGGSFATVREPVGRVHLDYTPWSAAQRVRQVLGEHLATQVLRGRFVILGLWRPTLDEPLQDAPLALADMHSVTPEDLVPNDLIYRDRQGQTYAVRYNESHRWYYFPLQKRDEVAIFVHYDSARSESPLPGAALHTAFENPMMQASAALRKSLEMRVLAWFEG